MAEKQEIIETEHIDLNNNVRATLAFFTFITLTDHRLR